MDQDDTAHPGDRAEEDAAEAVVPDGGVSKPVDPPHGPVLQDASEDAPEDAPPDRLQELLVDTSMATLELVAALRAAREGEPPDPMVQAELDRAELDFLVQQRARMRGSGHGLTGPVDRARAAAAAQRKGELLACDPGDPEALLDLAELRAECLHLGLGELAEALAGSMAERVPAVLEGDRDQIVAIARERWAALSAGTEGLPPRHRVVLLREMANVLRSLADGAELSARQQQRLRGPAGRLARAADDQQLSVRIVRRLGVRGAVLLERTSALLLVALVGLLVAEWVLPIPESWVEPLVLVDGIICWFFILEFFFKLALAPRKASWASRHAVTDLIPAVPAALYVLPLGFVGGGDGIAVLRVLRVLRPTLKVFRVFLFLVRGMDRVVHRFSPLLNRDFVFFESAAPTAGDRAPEQEEDHRTLLFRALRREHVLLSDLPRNERATRLIERSDQLTQRLEAAQASREARAIPTTGRDIPVERAIEQLYAVSADDLVLWLPRADLLSLDRVVRMLNAPVVRSLPVISRLRIRPMPATAEERVAAGCRRVAAWLEWWQGRLQWWADLHGIVTGPQILDRISGTMIKASKRPAVRLLMFGGLFTLMRLLVGDAGFLGSFLEKAVALPLVILGTVCLVILALGRWLNSIAGEASELFKRTSEANFLSLLEVVKARHQQEDTGFLARRMFRWEADPTEVQWALDARLDQLRRGDVHSGEATGVLPMELANDVRRTALLYLHFLDGAILHQSDVKTTEQLLANPSLANIRSTYLGYTKKQQRALNKLDLEDGSLLGGPYLWFRCITESIAVEAAKRVTEYNRHCVTLEQRQRLEPAQLATMDSWLVRRSVQGAGRSLEKTEPPSRGEAFSTVEFHALDFVTRDEDRERHLAETFGQEVVDVLRADRKRMVREIFGSRPLHLLPRPDRSFNAYRYYISKLSRGRFTLAPVYGLMAVFRLVGLGYRVTRDIVKEILVPELTESKRIHGRAPFAAALRKIHRMKAPGLLEACRMRVRFDPAYSGAPPTWSDGKPIEEDSELNRDLDFLGMKERHRTELQDHAKEVRRAVEELQARARSWGESGVELGVSDPGMSEAEREFDRKSGERAVTVAWVTNQDSLRTLAEAEDWFEETLAVMEDREASLPGSFVAGVFHGCCNVLRRHPVDRWLKRRLGQRRVSRRGRRNFHRLWRANRPVIRETVRAWLELPEGQAPADAALERARAAWRERRSVNRDMAALRAVQSLAVLDVRNYRALVFEIGDYAGDGERAGQAVELP